MNDFGRACLCRFHRLSLPALRVLVALGALAASADEEPAAEPPPTRDSRTVADNWDVLYVQGAKAGYGRTRVTEIVDDGKKLRQTDQSARLRFKRARQIMEMTMILQTTETMDDRLVDFRTEMTAGPLPMIISGRVVGDKLKMTTITGGRTATSTTAWSDAYRGFLYAEHTLTRKPMKKGERRSFQALVPFLNLVARTDLVAAGLEDTELLDGSRELMRINSTTTIAGTTVASTMWTDAEGRTLKTHETTMGQTTFRTTKEIALQDNTGVVPDLLVGSIVRPTGEVRNLHAAPQVRYRVTVTDGDPTAVFPDGMTQTVKSTGRNTAELTARRVRLSDSNLAAADASENPTDDDRDPNSFIQSDDDMIVALAKQVVPDEKDPNAIARALEQHVSDLITEKDFSTAMATASEVARSRQGDCSEHAVLLSAMCRARGLPSRTAVGLVYAPSLSGFGYHMWTEAWTGKNWMPLDATLPRGGIGAGHIKIAHSNLSEDTGMAVFLPILSVIGKLEIEVLPEE